MSEVALEKPESWLWHLLSFVLPSVALAGNVLGEWWVLSGFVLAFGIYPVLDWLLGEDHHRREVRTNGTPFEVLRVWHALLALPLVATVIWRGMEDGNAWTTWAAALSTGVAVGMSGIVVGHEMGHKKHKSARWYLGRMTLYLSLYPHFTTEHNHNHHRCRICMHVHILVVRVQHLYVYHHFLLLYHLLVFYYTFTFSSLGMVYFFSEHGPVLFSNLS